MSIPKYSSFEVFLIQYILYRQYSCATSEGRLARSVAYQGFSDFRSRKWKCCASLNARADHSTLPLHILQSSYQQNNPQSIWLDRTRTLFLIILTYVSLILYTKRKDTILLSHFDIVGLNLFRSRNICCFPQ